jgi:hypothetical protein
MTHANSVTTAIDRGKVGKVGKVEDGRIPRAENG